MVGEKEPYEYLIKSIESFISQRELIEKMNQNNFKNCKKRYYKQKFNKIFYILHVILLILSIN